MIPANKFPEDFTMDEEVETSRTYQLLKDKTQGYTNDLEALKQAIYKILGTEQYEYSIYSFDYGISLENLIGKDVAYVSIELQRRIEECLMEDERILSVDQFTFDTSGDELTCSFTVKSIYGEINIVKEVAY